MNRTDSYFRRNTTGTSLRRFSFRRKTTRDSIITPTSTWTFNHKSHEWQLLRGNYICCYNIYIYIILLTITYNILNNNNNMK
ncbi:unnamed protein product [Rotaria sp. Silwood1]|nr:unnamed protein product [Rotaria sp. Silwood1]